MAPAEYELKEVRTLKEANELGAQGFRLHSRAEHHDGPLYIMERQPVLELAEAISEPLPEARRKPKADDGRRA